MLPGLHFEKITEVSMWRMNYELKAETGQGLCQLWEAYPPLTLFLSWYLVNGIQKAQQQI